MFKTIIITSGMAVAALLFYAATRPGTFHIGRTVMIDAEPSAIYPYMSDFHQGRLWVPYEHKDPEMKRTFSGARSGNGSIYEFDGNRDVGKGRLEIVEAVEPTKVVMTLDMEEPMKGHNLVEYTIQPTAGGSEVTWAMSGRCDYMGKLAGIFINVDKMLGKDFTDGLNNLKRLVEKQ